MADFEREAMLESYLYEINQMLNSLEATCLQADSGFTESDINEVFRIMHTIKGASAMMQYDNIANVAHVVEDMFFYLREEKPLDYDSSSVVDITFESMDFVRNELSKIESGQNDFESEARVVESVTKVLKNIKGEVEETTSVKVNNNQVSKDSSDAELAKMFEEYIKTVEISDECTKFVIRTVLEDSASMKSVRMFNINSKFQEHYNYVTSYPAEVVDVSLDDGDWTEGLLNTFFSNENFEYVLSNLKKLSDIDYIDICTIPKNPKTFKIVFKENKYSATIKFKENDFDNFSNIFMLAEVLEEKVSAFTIRNIYFSSKKASYLDCIGLEIYSDIDNIEEISKIINSSQVVEYIDIILLNKADGSEDTKVMNIVEDKEIIQQAVVENQPKIVDSKVTVKPQPAASQVISVSVSKLDELLNLIRELVISESMVTHNPELEALNLESFQKDVRQLRKITNDVQDLVMSMRMVPLSKVFFKLNRIVRDMSKALNKEINLEIVGEETEVDKSIIEHISDPLMHMIRNSIDHGLESSEERLNSGKPKVGTVRLEAKNAGSEVHISLSDDGRGLDKDKILAKAKKNGLLRKDESEYTEKEIFQFIFLPGFSTNEAVTSYSGRGVGMDVATTNIISVGGSIDVSSERGQGTVFTLKIPLTLAIINGMLINIGDDVYILPIVSIKQSFKVKQEQITYDPDGNEMITLRGSVFGLLRLSEFFGIEPKSNNIEDGIVIMVENGDKVVCLLADALIGEHQVVVKSLPSYLDKVNGISGCTLLGSGDISIIIDINGLFNS